MRRFACHSCEFHVAVGFSLYFPSFPSCEPLDTSFNATCATCIRFSDSTPAAPSFPVFKFDFSTIQSRYVVITAFYTYELPSRVNRDHLRASILHATPWTGSPVRNPETMENVHAVATEFMTLACSRSLRRSTKHTRKSKSIRPSFKFISSFLHLWSLGSELLVKIVFKCLISMCTCKTLRYLKARGFVF